jgi:MFS superfamily sulfate permease-like transporter
LILGYVKAGIIGLYFPSSVIKGMLAGIGLILILKQIPYFLGVTVETFGDVSFPDKEGGNTITELIYAFQNIGWSSFLIGLIALGIMLTWELPFFKSRKIFRLLPGALVAVVAGLFISIFLPAFAPQYAIPASQLVQLPDIDIRDPQKLGALVTFPDWSALLNPVLWRAAIVIAIIASLETLLSIEAVDKLDPYKRHTPANRELKAQGVGNMLSGLIGGIPMTAVIVRSTANIEAGGKTKLAAVYHGIFLLVCVLIIPTVLNLIPLSALAAVLLLVGYKLAKPSLFKEQFHIGWDNFLPFVITIIAILLTDLLVGIIIGMVVGIFFILRANYKTPYHLQYARENTEEGRRVITIELSEHVSFLNKASILLTLDHLPRGSKVIVDGSRCVDIDHDALQILNNFYHHTAPSRNIEFHLENMPKEMARAIRKKSRAAGH